ncbi:high mobility group protein HMGI-C-like [Dreissena polymorpha]|uniref:high mobility group protein HMGI-C-like n=1 Tax=Dreissena polymorpha TaxID=45954 RepID=UPI002263BDF8|nr:high mobility group protein HMGI-C-like [Dreissena polymorpha]
MLFSDRLMSEPLKGGAGDGPAKVPDEEKRGRGRPRKPVSDEPMEPKQKRPRGRPLGSKKKPAEPPAPKKPRTKPRKAAGDVVPSKSDTSK